MRQECRYRRERCFRGTLPVASAEAPSRVRVVLAASFSLPCSIAFVAACLSMRWIFVGRQTAMAGDLKWKLSYFNYINRIADGLGVDDDEDWMARLSHEDWNRPRGRGYLKTIDAC